MTMHSTLARHTVEYALDVGLVAKWASRLSDDDPQIVAFDLVKVSHGAYRIEFLIGVYGSGYESGTLVMTLGAEQVLYRVAADPLDRGGLDDPEAADGFIRACLSILSEQAIAERKEQSGT